MRRILIGITLFLVLVAPVFGADKTIGVIMSGNVSYYQDVHRAFVSALVKEGFDHSKVDTLLQMPSPDSMSWANAVRKLSVADANVLITYGGAASLMAIRETKVTPVVYSGVYDPVSIGMSARNASGISSKVPLTSLLKYLKKITPFTRIAVIYNESEADSMREVEELSKLEAQYGFQTVRMPVKRADEARKLVFTGKADAVFITVSAAVNEAVDSIVKNAREAKLITASQLGGTADHGIVLTLSASAIEQGEAAARLTARLLRGENVVGLPAETPKLIELTVNVREATALGIKVPFDLITDATRVIK